MLVPSLVKLNLYSLGLICFLFTVPGANPLYARPGKYTDNVLFSSVTLQNWKTTGLQATSTRINYRGAQISGEKIITTALNEKNQGPENVGNDLNRYPYRLSRYLQPGEAWCSEFVSWVYKVADSPFTDGFENGWMLKNTQSIKAWFEKHKKFISHADPAWSFFIPQPGDYIRYNNDHGGHSGIVNYVDGDRLYTIEGNVGNRVRERIIDDWRHFKELDGIGVKSIQPVQNNRNPQNP